MVTVAVIGAGQWGKNLVRNFATLEQARLKYVCDLSEKVRRGMAALYPKATVTGSSQEILDDPAVDAVVLAVDAPYHFDLARRVLEAGKHCFVEKPLTLSAADSQALVDLSDKAGKVLMVGHLLEYHPCVNFMKDAIRDGVIGNPLYLYFQRLNLGIVRSQENAWWSLAPHDVSVACYLFDADPVSVSASGQAYLQKSVEDVVFASLKVADGRMAHIHVSWLDPHKIRKVTLVGSSKMITFDDMDPSEKIRIYDKGAVKSDAEGINLAISVRSGDINIPHVGDGEPLRDECLHFIDSILKGTSPRSDGRDGLRVVKVLEAGAESLERGGELVQL